MTRKIISRFFSKCVCLLPIQMGKSVNFSFFFSDFGFKPVTSPHQFVFVVQLCTIVESLLQQLRVFYSPSEQIVSERAMKISRTLYTDNKHQEERDSNPPIILLFFNKRKQLQKFIRTLVFISPKIAHFFLCYFP